MELEQTAVKLRPSAVVCEIEDMPGMPAARASSRTGKEMTRKSRHPDFDQTLELLRSHSFAVTPYSAGGALVSKNGVGAVLAPAPKVKDGTLEAAEDASPSVFAVGPGALIRGEVARLVDRGYQKFIKTSQYELPASASQLQAIHAFSDELKQLIGSISLYNQALGTTSDRYLYDRLEGREGEQPKAARPWELAGEH
jgi:hypothetical protein